MPKRQNAANVAASSSKATAGDRGEVLVQHLQKMFSEVVEEPIPDDLLNLMKQLDGGQKAK